MAILQYSVTLRNNQLDQIDVTAGGTAILKIRNGAIPANCAAADTGTALAVVTNPASWMAAASGGSVIKSGTWEDLSADAAGTATHFRLYANDGVTCHIQGDVGQTGGTQSMLLDNTVFAPGQVFTVTQFTITAGNA